MMRPINEIIVHCADTYATMDDIGAAEIRQWHLDRGFDDIGYHYVIRRNGDVEPGRGVEVAGAHASGHNAASIGICLVGGKGEDGGAENNFTDDQFNALTLLLDDLLWQFPGAEVLGHRDLPGVTKACPSFDVKSWWEKD